MFRRWVCSFQRWSRFASRRRSPWWFPIRGWHGSIGCNCIVFIISWCSPRRKSSMPLLRWLCGRSRSLGHVVIFRRARRVCGCDTFRLKGQSCSSCGRHFDTRKVVLMSKRCFHLHCHAKHLKIGFAPNAWQTSNAETPLLAMAKLDSIPVNISCTYRIVVRKVVVLFNGQWRCQLLCCRVFVEQMFVIEMRAKTVSKFYTKCRRIEYQPRFEITVSSMEFCEGLSRWTKCRLGLNTYWI